MTTDPAAARPMPATCAPDGSALTDPLVLAMGVLLVTDLAGGAVAARSGLNTWGQAWGSQARLAAPVPMIAAQLLLTTLTVRMGGRGAAIAAALLAAACLLSVVSGFFDGGLSDPALTTGTRALQLLLLSATTVVGALAAVRARRRWRWARG